MGVANRTDYDLNAHMKATKENLEYLDPITNEKYVPYVIEPSMGLDRLMLAILVDSYDEEKLDKDDVRTVLHLHKDLAPYQVAILPLVKKLSDKAEKIYQKLMQEGFSVAYDEAGSIGKRYRRQDSIGTPVCVTIDFDSLEDKCVTLRDRDTMAQKRVKISQLVKELKK